MKRIAVVMATLLMMSSLILAMAGDRRDYTTIHNFNVEIDGVVVGGFREVSGLEDKVVYIDYDAGMTPLIQVSHNGTLINRPPLVCQPNCFEEQ